MDRKLIKNLKDIYRKLVSEEQTSHFVAELRNICPGCRVYLYSETQFLTGQGEDQERYADLHDLPALFLEEYRQYVNGQGVLYYVRGQIPVQLEDIFPKSAGTILWFPVQFKGRCYGFICLDKPRADGFQQEQLDSIYLLLDAVGYFLATCLKQYETDHSIASLSVLLDELGTYLYLIDEDSWELTHASAGLKEMFPLAKEPGIKCYQAICGRDQKEPCSHACPIHQLRAGTQDNSVEIFLPQLDKWLKASARYYSKEEEGNQILVALNDISEVKEKELAIERVAYRDSLLGIYNRVAFTRDLLRMVEQDAQDVYALLIDIEDFKQLNDIFGFETGNLLLQQIVRELEALEMLNQTYRFAGGQFAVMLQDADILQAVTLVRTFLTRFENGVELEDKHINVNINTAIVSNKDGEFSVDNFVTKMECAIEEVKANPSNFLILGKPMEDKMKRTNLVKQVIKNTLDQRNIMVVYQPIYNIANNRFMKAEALARIYDEELGWVSPVEFIPLAEKMGRIHDLDMMVMERVCRQICEMKQNGIHFSSVHINISVAQLVEKNFIEQVLALIDRYGIPHHEIELEVTESTLFSSMEMGESVIKKFKAQGINAALDDFGTGYSSLDYVINLPFHTLKINMALIRHIVDSEKFRKMVKYIIRIAKDFNMDTIAEGVENYEQYCILRDLGCDNIQGYYFAKPMLKDQIIKKGLTSPDYCNGKSMSG